MISKREEHISPVQKSK